MSYVTSPFEVMTIIFVLCIFASVGATTLFNRFVYDIPFKYDVAATAALTLIVFVLTARAIF